jgi:hypothetical protein
MVTILTCARCAIGLNYSAKAVCVQSELPKNLVERHWKEIRPSNQWLTPSTETAVSEAE